ncbi:cyclic pyranopterin monophosphate synthase subunit MoaA [Paraburkholderia caballeronis]|uniref:GTP 3',8-cyclase n=1 Tax=Paraburkholderia caballeronis TaxID=416943 RepID=A0A1H7MIK2_9BURK|nr:GTP 3',8-cyclase MoaA [Paraburkholderia caballeronis]PXW26562.1 cyclic pyranopterin monophosphate synthase subunit MoaA [Paraburkholderia caballeronis]PXX02109.1 cyclic pyranopterin monophosphate synthase subunit MoaA [Paraburkholderia caballeronis]RAK01266.1 cyclic pyranopterin monophosphate synthase subunit MoaA [Paraburkholderia caballeronis]SEB88490.1 cyclic pyranopterin monophosphate synthase subunit MoaA [Paraburkholderia caballeronis]SEL11126.1 cyclic pyranopterin monophosphate synth
MSRRIIPLTDARSLPPLPTTARVRKPQRLVLDALERPLRDLRISVTDRCNFRCVYCMPRAVFDKDYPFLPHAALLTLEEIERLARLFVAQGVGKIRLTGGEPLLRKNIEFLIERLAALRTPDGEPLDLTLTTNGSLLTRKARALKDAGLTRVTVSLDALDDALFRRMNDADFAVSDVLDGIEAAQAVGLAPLKVNMVVKRGTNDQEIVPMARHFRNSGVTLRFIEYMDVGTSNGWNMTEVLPSADVVARIDAHYPLAPLEAHTAAETAQRWGYVDGAGEIGVISSVTRAFCGNCTRARLSTEGKLYLCLFASMGYDLRALVRNGATDEGISAAIAQIWEGRADRYSQLRGSAATTPSAAERRVEMSYIGG